MHARWLPSFCLLLTALLAGCATHADRLREVRGQFYSGNLEKARSTINTDVTLHGGEANVLKLERAIVDLSAGHPKDAEQTLREVRDAFDYLEQKSLAEGALAIATDDNAMSYAGEDYEKILIRAFLALSNLMGDGGDAEAYSLQVAEKQDQIIQHGTDETGKNLKADYKRVALGAYLRGVLREETHFDYDDAARSWAKVVSWEPAFAPGPDDVQRAEHGTHCRPGNGVLYVFALVGRGPYKVEKAEVRSSIAMLIGDRIVSGTARHTLPPTLAPIKVPMVVVSPFHVAGVEVAVDGHGTGVTQTITDVGRLAVEQYQAVYPAVLTRAVLRRLAKKGTIYAVKEATGTKNNSWQNLVFDLAGVAWEASESADTRCWGLLPDKIQVLRIELPAGEHRIGLHATGSFAHASEEQTLAKVVDGRNTYLLANFPDDHLVGKILQSNR
jgi:hypothetical protein